MQYRQNVLPVWQKKLSELLGYELEIEAEWDTLGAEDCAHIMEKGLNAIYFEPLELAIREIAIDDFAKQALRDGFKKFFFSGKEPEDRIFYRFENKTLSYRHNFSNIENYVNERRQRIVHLFEKNL
ncbi:hypothetical protein LZ198_04525 [Myxococcus sp. K15C18031901]|uniref:hypothetical protein n=1 Tax=Myxococcus dinghuensis TaxID=2906761 RepID=UPI0020A7C34E|nr:hypothetical protein [Myxococcus dinghuensis]MCP3098141.1 hypothetical protein [Myxococcus dinghuensis]